MYSNLISFSESGMTNVVGRKLRSPRPYLRANRTSAGVTLEFEMDGQESILIYSKRGEEEYVFLREMSRSPFVDERPNLTKYSENRMYKAVFASDGVPIGEDDFIEIKTKGRFRFF